MTEIFYLVMVLVGILSSFIGSIIGAGGGIVNVPVLIFLNYAEYSSGISLIAIISTATFSSVFNIRKKLVDFKIALIFIPFQMIGSIIGAYLFDVIKSLNIDLFKLLFTILLIFVGLRIYFKRDAEEDEIKITKIEVIDKKIIIFGILGGVAAGTASGLLGIGGGVVVVPFLTLVMNASIHVAIATSLFIMIFSSSSGVINHILNGNLPIFAIYFGIFLGIGAILGSSIGSRVAYRLKDKKIKKVYGLITICIAIPLIWLRILLPTDPIQVFFNNFRDFFSGIIS
ncbi:MAG: sulfite exporter TauE/SafE family protein [Candidatus Hodarchaeota archaeon]